MLLSRISLVMKNQRHEPSPVPMIVLGCGGSVQALRVESRVHSVSRIPQRVCGTGIYHSGEVHGFLALRHCPNTSHLDVLCVDCRTHVVVYTIERARMSMLRRRRMGRGDGDFASGQQLDH
jgi:hypothetical protein